MPEPLTQEQVRAAVGAVTDPDVGRTYAELGAIQAVEVGRRGRVSVTAGLVVPGGHHHQAVRDEMAAAVAALDGVSSVSVDFVELPEPDLHTMAAQVRGTESPSVAAVTQGTRTLLVASGKGGVGKSSVTTNLAVALSDMGKTVGIIDADVWGFSIPKMLGVDEVPAVFGDMLVPTRAHGVKAISMDYFVPPDQAVIWRGPMLHKAVEQFLGEVWWDSPDYLIVDMPPGTGDVAISVSQQVPRAESIVITTPQLTAQRVARRAALMARQVEQEVVGVVENMAWFTGDDGKRYHLFGEGGGQALADDLGVPLLGRIPLLPTMREGADEGRPVFEAAPDSEAAQAFRDLATEIDKHRPKVRTHPELTIR